jgi:hypothetical protein
MPNQELAYGRITTIFCDSAAVWNDWASLDLFTRCSQPGFAGLVATTSQSFGCLSTVRANSHDARYETHTVDIWLLTERFDDRQRGGK